MWAPYSHVVLATPKCMPSPLLQTQGALGFYRATVWSRMMLSVAFVMLVVARESPPGLLVLAAINLLGAVSMRVALAHSGGGGTTTTTSQSDGADTAMKM